MGSEEQTEDEQVRRINLKRNEKKEKEKRDSNVTARATIYVVFACTVSASSGLLFGYE